MSRKSEKIVFVTRPLKMKGKPKSLGERAGLIFPVRRIYGQLKSGYYASRIGIGAAIYLTAVLEYLSQEILELAAKAALENQKKRISPRHVLLAIRNDKELCLMLKGVVISEGGVLPNIEPELLPKKIAIQKNYLKNPVNASSQEY